MSLEQPQKQEPSEQSRQAVQESRPAPIPAELMSPMTLSAAESEIGGQQQPPKKRTRSWPKQTELLGKRSHYQLVVFEVIDTEADRSKLKYIRVKHDRHVERALRLLRSERRQRRAQIERIFERSPTREIKLLSRRKRTSDVRTMPKHSYKKSSRHGPQGEHPTMSRIIDEVQNAAESEVAKNLRLKKSQRRLSLEKEGEDLQKLVSDHVGLVARKVVSKYLHKIVSCIGQKGFQNNKSAEVGQNNSEQTGGESEVQLSKVKREGD